MRNNIEYGICIQVFVCRACCWGGEEMVCWEGAPPSTSICGRQPFEIVTGYTLAGSQALHHFILHFLAPLQHYSYATQYKKSLHAKCFINSWYFRGYGPGYEMLFRLFSAILGPECLRWIIMSSPCTIS